MPLRLGLGIGVPFAGSVVANWNPSLGGWKNYGDMTDPAQIELLHTNNNYTGTAVDASVVQSIEMGIYGTRGLKETAISGPIYEAAASVGAYSGPALYYGGNRRLLGDSADFTDFGSHSVMMVGGFRSGPTAGAIWTKGGAADARGTILLNTNEYRLFNGTDTGTGNFVGVGFSIEILEYTYNHGTGNHKFWRNGSVIYDGTGPGTDGGRLWCVGKGSGGFLCADFYCIKWAMKGGVMTETERLSQRAYWGF